MWLGYVFTLWSSLWSATVCQAIVWLGIHMKCEWNQIQFT